MYVAGAMRGYESVPTATGSPTCTTTGTPMSPSGRHGGPVLSLAGPGGRVLELGVGTGRLALPMAAGGSQVVGVDTSAAMLDRLAERDVSGDVTAIRGDMVDDLPDGPFDAALVAYNTLFNLLDEVAQRRASSRSPGGSARADHSWSRRSSRTPTAGLRPRPTSRADTGRRPRRAVGVGRRSRQPARRGAVRAHQRAGGVRLRPWSIRWATPAQLDGMADRAGSDTARTVRRHGRRGVRRRQLPARVDLHETRHTNPKCALRCAPSAHESAFSETGGLGGVGSCQKEW